MKVVNLLAMRTVQVYDHYKMNGIHSILKETIYYKRGAKVIEKDLSQVVMENDQLNAKNLRTENITFDKLQSNEYFFTYKNRNLKALHYLKQGCGGHGLFKGNEIIGDWYYPKENFKGSKLHADVKLLRIDWKPEYVYSVDTFLSPGHRGKNIAWQFQNNHLYLLSKCGFKKAYGYYWEDNFPAVWTSKVMNKWEEKQRIFISKFIVLRTSHLDKEKLSR